jgi:dephospho-CoA kinase
MLVWGLTGNIACGKSAVQALVEDRGIPVIDADQVAREVVEAGQPALEEIASAFGESVIRSDGQLDRPALAAIVFADGNARKRLEAITHPRIIARTLERIGELAAEGHPLAVVSAALMVESGSYKGYAGLAVVTCPGPIQLQRLQARDGLSEGDALARIEAQFSQEQKAGLADVVLDNRTGLEELRDQVDRWISGLEGG